MSIEGAGSPDHSPRRLRALFLDEKHLLGLVLRPGVETPRTMPDSVRDGRLAQDGLMELDSLSLAEDIPDSYRLMERDRRPQQNSVWQSRRFPV